MTEDGTEGGFYSALAAGAFICALGAVAFFLPVIGATPGIDLIGLLLIGVGFAEVAAGWARRGRRTGRTAIGGGAITILISIFFMVNPRLEVVPASYLIMVWLFVRGALLLYSSFPWRDPECAWPAASGFVDITLGLILVLGLPVTGLTVSLFGPTPEIIAHFSLLVAVSFLVAGISLIGMSFHRRRTVSPSASPAPPSPEASAHR